MNQLTKHLIAGIAVLGVAALVTGCGGKKDGAAGSTEGAKAGDVIKIDGSSTVFPISEAVAEEFEKAAAKSGAAQRVTIGVSGTGGGFKKFCAKETAIAGASRSIKPSEVALCEKAGVAYKELSVAYDGIAVVVHPSNDFVDHLTVEELKRMWAPEAQGKVMKWSQIRTGWPDKELHLFGPGVDSGTYDYFTKKIVGKEHSSRGDYTSSEDDNVLVTGIARDKGGLGFFGFAYYAENQDKLKIVPVKKGDKAPVTPTLETIKSGTYAPLSRPIFIYISKVHGVRQEVKDFVKFYLTEGRKLVAEVGYIPLKDTEYDAILGDFDKWLATP